MWFGEQLVPNITVPSGQVVLFQLTPVKLAFQNTA
jgi:hypothetical protein